MKKIYSNPEIKVVKILACSSILAESLGKDKDNVISDNNAVLGREFDFNEED